MKCPYCSKYHCEPDVVVINVENYGSKRCNFECVHCGKVVSVWVERRIVFGKPSKTSAESDW